MDVAVHQVPPPLNYDGELDFDDKAWASARAKFIAGRKAQKKRADTDEALDDFLRQSCSPQDARKYVADVQKEKPQYQAGLGGILTKIDAFMKVGDLAIKSAPESVGLAWAGIRLCLHSVQDDFATFSQYNDACGDMIGILINCTVYGGMYGKPHGAKILEEIHRQVLDCIPDIYAGLLDFNYSMRKHTQTNRGIRILVGTYKSAAAKYKDKFAFLKENEKKMRDFAATASQQLTQYYQEIGLENDKRNVEAQMAIIGSLASIDATIREAFKSQEESLRRLEDAIKDSKKQTPFEKAQRLFELNEQSLEPGTENQAEAFSETLNREPGTCQWIFKEDEYREWHTSETNSMLWVSANGGFGKSYLMGSIIETLKKTELEDENVTVSFFFCKRGNDSTQKSEKIKKSILYQLYHLAKDNPDLLEEANRLVTSLDSSAKSKKDGKKDGKDAKSQLESNKKTLPFVEVYQGLARLMKKTIFLIVDALDEIDDLVDQAFLDEFRSIAEIPDIKLHLLFGSRPGGDIASALKGVPIVDVQGRNEPDIRRNVTTLVGQLSGFSTSERALAVNDIVQKAGGQFRYVKPALDFLRLPWSRPLETRLRQLQRGLTNSYTQALQLTDPNYIDLLKTSLTWALLGEGQVTVKEVMDAFSCTFGEDQDDQDVEDIGHDEQPLKQVQQAGNTFLDVNWDTGVLAPRHETVTDYFLNDLEDSVESGTHDPSELCSLCKKGKHGTARPFHITRKDGHLEIATTILQNLSSPAFWRKHFKDEYWKLYFPDVTSFDLKENDAPDVASVEETANIQEIAAGNTEKQNGAQDPDGVNGPVSLEPEKETGVKTNGEESKTEANALTELPTNILEAAEDQSLEPLKPPELSLTEVDGTITSEMPADSLIEKTDPATETVTEPANAAENNVEDADAAADEGSGENKETLAPPQEDVPDDVSDADSDLNVEAEDWAFKGKDVPSNRYEVSHCVYHLQKVEEYWKGEDRNTPKFERLRALIKGFFVRDSPYFRRWLTVQTGMPSSYFYYEYVKDIHPLSVGGAYELTEILSLYLKDEEEKKKLPLSAINQALYNAGVFHSGEDTTALSLLLENGADPNSTDHGLASLSPFQILLLLNHKIKAVKLFIEHGARVDVSNTYGWYPIHYLASAGDNEDVDVLNALLENGGDINSKDGEDAETPLHFLVRRRDPPLDLLREFIAKKANVNENDKEEQRPLYEVCMSGNVEAARILLEAGAEVHAADLQGTTALHIAASGGHTKTCQLLIETGAADITKFDKKNQSAFLLACGSGNPETPLYLATQLKEQDAAIFSAKTITGKSPLTKAAARGHTEAVKMLLQKIDVKAEINEQDKKRRNTPLHVASMNGSKEIVQLLLENGASTTIFDKSGNTPFRASCKRWAQSSLNDAGALIILMDKEPLASLLDNKDLLNTAAMKGNIPVLTKLLDKGASLNQQDEHGWTPLQLAIQYGHEDAEKLLAERGAVVGRRPTAWKSSVETVEISEDGKTVGYIALDRNETGVLSDHPIPAGVKRYYYEISITEPGGKNTFPIVGLGLCNLPPKTTNWFPGWSNKNFAGAPSWGYHGDDGHLFTSKAASKIPELIGFPQYGHEDVIGCGVDFDLGEIFYTRNGEKMQTAFKDVKGRLHPVVGLASAASVLANFGDDVLQTPFKWEKANVQGGGWAD